MAYSGYAAGQVPGWFNPVIPHAGKTYVSLHTEDPVRRSGGSIFPMSDPYRGAVWPPRPDTPQPVLYDSPHGYSTTPFTIKLTENPVTSPHGGAPGPSPATNPHGGLPGSVTFLDPANAVLDNYEIGTEVILSLKGTVEVDVFNKGKGFNLKGSGGHQLSAGYLKQLTVIDHRVAPKPLPEISPGDFVVDARGILFHANEDYKAPDDYNDWLKVLVDDDGECQDYDAVPTSDLAVPYHLVKVVPA